MQRFVYAKIEDAKEDLKIFCGLFSTSGSPMYLVSYGPGYTIDKTLMATERPLAIGLNGVVFTPDH